ncbi:hypothetical protein [Desulfoscipio gibsoniae]
MLKGEMNNKVYIKYPYGHIPGLCLNMAGMVRKRVVLLLDNEDGFMSVKLLMALIIAGIFTATVMISIGIGIQTKATTTFDWFCEAMDFSAHAANMDGETSMVGLRESDAKRYFKITFAQITESAVSGDAFNPSTNYYPGPIKLQSYKSVQEGDPVPGGTARAPGYIATIEVPVWGGNIPLVGHQYITVPMKYYAVVKSQHI